MSTFRLYDSSNTRVSTAVEWNNKILQVWPVENPKPVFDSMGMWMAAFPSATQVQQETRSSKPNTTGLKRLVDAAFGQLQKAIQHEETTHQEYLEKEQQYLKFKKEYEEALLATQVPFQRAERISSPPVSFASGGGIGEQEEQGRCECESCRKSLEDEDDDDYTEYTDSDSSYTEGEGESEEASEADGEGEGESEDNEEASEGTGESEETEPVVLRSVKMSEEEFMKLPIQDQLRILFRSLQV